MNAPAGGMVSKVNGQWYEGGEYMPEHGLYCGTGSARMKKTEIDAVRAKLDDSHKIEWDEVNQVWALYQLVTFAAGFRAWQRTMNYRTVKSLRKVFAV